MQVQFKGGDSLDQYAQARFQQYSQLPQNYRNHTEATSIADTRLLLPSPLLRPLQQPQYYAEQLRQPTAFAGPLPLTPGLERTFESNHLCGQKLSQPMMHARQTRDRCNDRFKAMRPGSHAVHSKGQLHRCASRIFQHDTRNTEAFHNPSNSGLVQRQGHHRGCLNRRIFPSADIVDLFQT
jgi:hypothetical protein